MTYEQKAEAGVLRVGKPPGHPARACAGRMIAMARREQAETDTAIFLAAINDLIAKGLIALASVDGHVTLTQAGTQLLHDINAETFS